MGREHLRIGEHGEFTELKVGDRFVVRAGYRNADGTYKRYQESSRKSHASAKRKLRDKFREFGETTDDEIGRNSRIREVADVVLAEIGMDVQFDNVSPGTLRMYRSVWTNHLLGRVGNLSVGELTVQRADKVLRDIATTASLDTAKAAKVFLTRVMGKAVTYQAIAMNPMRSTKRVPVKVRSSPKALTPEQVIDVLVQLNESEKARSRDIPDLVLWMLGTSERRGNALAAAWSRIDFERGIADLGPNVITPKGSPPIVRGDELSSKTKERPVGLPDTVLRMLRLRWTVLGSNPTGLVFPNQKRSGPLDPDRVSKWMKEAMVDAGYPWVTSHVFRKTAATVLDDAGVSPRQIADRLGHSRVAITQDTYMRRRGDSEAGTAALEAVLSRWAPVTPLRATGTEAGAKT